MGIPLPGHICGLSNVDPWLTGASLSVATESCPCRGPHWFLDVVHAPEPMTPKALFFPLST